MEDNEFFPIQRYREDALNLTRNVMNERWYGEQGMELRRWRTRLLDLYRTAERKKRLTYELVEKSGSRGLPVIFDPAKPELKKKFANRGGFSLEPKAGSVGNELFFFSDRGFRFIKGERISSDLPIKITDIRDMDFLNNEKLNAIATHLGTLGSSRIRPAIEMPTAFHFALIQIRPRSSSTPLAGHGIRMIFVGDKESLTELLNDDWRPGTVLSDFSKEIEQGREHVISNVFVCNEDGWQITRSNEGKYDFELVGL